jgi:TatD DNase family protein
MMNYIDTHSHLYLPEFDADRDQVIERAVGSGVKKILLPNIDSSSIPRLNRMVSDFPEICHAMMGLHPTSVKDNYPDELNRVQKELSQGIYAGIGEIGIDLYRDKTYFRQQCAVFEAQLDLALKYNLAVAIHARESFAEILDLIRGYRNKGLKGIFHAFTGDTAIAREVTDMGFKLGIGGILTYKKSDLPSVIRDIALEHMVLETDAPYLSPVPYRGKRNESSYIPVIAGAVQQIKNVPLEEVARITTENAVELFHLS